MAGRYLEHFARTETLAKASSIRVRRASCYGYSARNGLAVPWSTSKAPFLPTAIENSAADPVRPSDPQFTVPMLLRTCPDTGASFCLRMKTYRCGS
jgi:hypothetical protein